MQIIVQGLGLGGRKGSAGLFRSRRHGALQVFDLEEILRRVGMKGVLERLVVWRSDEAPELALVLPTVGNFAGALRSIRANSTSTVPFDIVPRGDLSELKPLVKEILGMPTPRGTADGNGSYFDSSTGKLVSHDGAVSIEVSPSQLGGLVGAGVLFETVSEFGEPCFQINPRSIQWQAAAEIETGTRNAVSHVSQTTPQKHPKLAIQMLLVHTGWSSRARDDPPRYYADGGPKWMDISPSRLFVRLNVAACARAVAVFVVISPFLTIS